MKIDTTSRIREIFVPREGFKFVISDLAQIEPRLTAHYAAKLFPDKEQECPLLKTFLTGVDLYASVANEVLSLGLPVEKLQKSVFKKEFSSERAFGKEIQLATTYGLGPGKLSTKLSRILNKKISYKKAKHYIDIFWDKFWDIKALRNNCYDEILKSGYMDTIFGRKLAIPISQARHKGLNYKIQSSASDFCLFTQLWVKEELKKYNFDAKLLLLIHDEVIYEVRDGQENQFKLLLQTIMLSGWRKYRPDMELLVPLEADTIIGTSWADKE